MSDLSQVYGDEPDEDGLDEFNDVATQQRRHALPPRGLTRQEAAAYAGCQTISAFKERIRRGLLPGPMPGTRTWDRKAIDAALDRASGLTAKSGLSPLEEWRAKRARRSEGGPHRQEAVGQR